MVEFEKETLQFFQRIFLLNKKKGKKKINKKTLPCRKGSSYFTLKLIWGVNRFHR